MSALPLTAGLATLGRYFAGPAFHGAKPAHLPLSLLALHWFPLGHALTFVRALGLDPGVPRDIQLG